MTKDQINKEKQVAVEQLATLDKEIETFLSTREGEYKKATKVIKEQIAEFSTGLYQKRHDDYHAVTPLKARRTELTKQVANCDAALKAIEDAEAEKPQAGTPKAEPPVAPTPAVPVGKKAKGKKAKAA